jgi:hypothetical protein
MFGFRSARGRATLVGLALTLFLVGVTTFHGLASSGDKPAAHELEHASDTAAALEHARAQLCADEPAFRPVFIAGCGLVDQYRQAQRPRADLSGQSRGHEQETKPSWRSWMT